MASTNKDAVEAAVKTGTETDSASNVPSPTANAEANAEASQALQDELEALRAKNAALETRLREEAEGRVAETAERPRKRSIEDGLAGTKVRSFDKNGKRSSHGPD